MADWTQRLIYAALATPWIMLLVTSMAWAEPHELKEAESFDIIETTEIRAAALFVEAARVFQHPRCVNCHGVEEGPLQGENMLRHQPRVVRGKDGLGTPGMRCYGCHQKANYMASKVPGAPHWSVAPRSMELVGKSAGEICAAIKDPVRNGGRSIEKVVAHLDHDPLVIWAWEPGADRVPAPGSHAEFMSLVRAWAEAGAHCPTT